MPEPDVAAAVARLDELTRRLRRECPWDREQDERSIVPHTVEEAYELADAANARRRRQAARRARRRALPGPLPLAAARGARRRATWRRSPSTCARSSSAATRTSSARSRPQTAGEVLRNWDEIKRSEPGREDGIFGEVPENLPALLHARKVQRRAASSGFDFDRVPYDAVERRARGARGRRRPSATPPSTRSATCSSRPSTSRASCASTPSSPCARASGRFRGRVEAAEELAARAPAPTGSDADAPTTS